MNRIGFLIILSLFGDISIALSNPGMGRKKSSEERAIHVIKIMDSNNRDAIIKAACESVSNEIDREVELLAQYLDIEDVNTYDATGSNFNFSNVQYILESEMQYVGLGNDIFFLVYLGHGSRTDKTSGSFPDMLFMDSEEKENYSKVYDQILETRPSVFISMIIACNNRVGNTGEELPFIVNNTPPSDYNTILASNYSKTERYQELFYPQPGYTKAITLMSSDVNEYTILDVHGGIYFREVMNQFKRAFSSASSQSWDNIVSQIDINTYTKTRRLKNNRQGQRSLSTYDIVPQIATVLGKSKGFGLFRRSQCETELRDMRKRQKAKLRSLKQKHKEEIISLKRTASRRSTIRNEKKANLNELNVLKLRHKRVHQQKRRSCR